MCKTHITHEKPLSDDDFQKIAVSIIKQKPDMDKFLFNIVKKYFEFAVQQEEEEMKTKCRALFAEI
jgi:hypothetical protein